MNRSGLLSFSISVFFALVVVSCLLDASSPGEEFIISQVYSVDSLQIVHNAERELRLKTYSTVPNPCHEFSSVQIDRDDTDILLTIFSKVNKETICAQVLGTLEAQIALKVNEPGEYHLQFLGKSSDLDTTITIN